jgi:xanthine dehydrogenase accessory factor
VTDANWDWTRAVQTLTTEGRAAVLVTLVRCDGSTPRAVGAKMLVDASGRFAGSIGGGALEERAIAEAQVCLQQRTSKLVHVALGPELGQCCGGAVDVFCETLGSGPDLYVFGAGHVAQSVAQVLAGTPFNVHLVDERSEWLNAPAVPPSVVRHDVAWDELIAKTEWSPVTSYAVVMTHSHELDEQIVRGLFAVRLRFLGLIGSATKWQRIKKRLAARGALPADIDRVRCPVGLDIGGKAPREVAISIASEILAIHYNKR